MQLVIPYCFSHASMRAQTGAVRRYPFVLHLLNMLQLMSHWCKFMTFTLFRFWSILTRPTHASPRHAITKHMRRKASIEINVCSQWRLCHFLHPVYGHDADKLNKYDRYVVSRWKRQSNWVHEVERIWTQKIKSHRTPSQAAAWYANCRQILLHSQGRHSVRFV